MSLEVVWIGIEERYTCKDRDFKERSNRARRVTFLNPLQKGARNPGTFSHLAGGDLPLDPSDADHLRQKFECLSILPRIRTL
jgi:hypothetical protein